MNSRRALVLRRMRPRLSRVISRDEPGDDEGKSPAWRGAESSKSKKVAKSLLNIAVPRSPEEWQNENCGAVPGIMPPQLISATYHPVMSRSGNGLQIGAPGAREV